MKINKQLKLFADMTTSRFFAILIVSVYFSCTAFAASKRPNIVFLISDDDYYTHFGFMGNELAHTPSLDRLVNQGTLFTTAHAPSPLCRPSLASLLSGKLPHQNGIYSNYMNNGRVGGDSIILTAKGSLANKMKDAGYKTYATAKFWEGDARKMGFTHGTVDISIRGFRKFVRKDKQQELFQFIDQQHEKNPLFIWWAPLLPHDPHNPPAELMARFKDAKIPVPAHYKGNKADYIHAMRKFYAMGSWFDRGVSDLKKKLKSVGELDNTLFVFYVDNGLTFGLTSKNSPFEAGLRTPMFVSGAKLVPKGKRITGLNYALDLHATMLDYAGIKPEEGIASKSLRPLIEGKIKHSHKVLCGAVYAHHAYQYSRLHKLKNAKIPAISPERDIFALHARSKRWKYILFTQDVNRATKSYQHIFNWQVKPLQAKQGEERLYDLESDPYEQNNLAKDPRHQKKLKRLRSEALNWWKTTGGKTIPGLLPYILKK
ncbi:MAG: sulfatase-like hydrolase/transferase [Lentisphaeraceae bacterium]|nr:sulfatase-like hydrolase/transferase [Lentisphaeraceae bacterium]